jgi:hypothetical protein
LYVIGIGVVDAEGPEVAEESSPVVEALRGERVLECGRGEAEWWWWWW